MSRNLCMVGCHRCGAESVRLDEEPRELREGEAGPYFEEYCTMLVADATCPDCDARYLAWCRSPTRGIHMGLAWQGGDYYDLSYRSTFDDEPGDEDVPKPSGLRLLEQAILTLRNHDALPSPAWAVWIERNLVPARDLLARKLGWAKFSTS